MKQNRGKTKKASGLYPALGNKVGKLFERPVPCLFHLSWKTASGKLPVPEVIGDTFAAYPFS